MGWIEARTTYREERVSFRAEDVLYFTECKEGTYVVIGRQGDHATYTFTTPYDEFKEQVDTIKQFQRDWVNATIQGSSPANVQVVPLGETKAKFVKVPFNREDLCSGQYIRFKEDVGDINKPRYKECKGWIQNFTHHPDDIINVSVRCDDQWNGARGTTINIEDILEILPNKEQPKSSK